MSYLSIDEAMAFGHGIERQFVCHVHDDKNPSASINSITGLWFCYGCGAAGKYDTDKMDPQLFWKNIERFLEEEAESREYTESWLDQYDSLGASNYWLTRFRPETVRKHRLGQNYQGTYATIPVRSESGTVLGVIRRDLTGKDSSKYRYPVRVKISRLLYNFEKCSGDEIILTEGATDAIAADEAGFPDAMATYRNGLSEYQIGMLHRYAPRRIYVAYDQDKPGNQGADLIMRKLSRFTEVYRLTWTDYKDLASIPLEDRRNLCESLDTLAHV